MLQPAPGLFCREAMPRRSVRRPVSLFAQAAVVGSMNMRALLAFLFLIVMLVIGARVRGVRDSLWRFLAFIAACVVVLALLLAILAK